MLVFLRHPGQLLALAMLVLQPAGSLGECRSPARFLRFCLSALLADQIRNKQQNSAGDLPLAKVAAILFQCLMFLG